MPPHLHPRSTATSTLFAGTLLASFIVVGIPHVFPCPRPRTGYAADAGRIDFDDDGNPIPIPVRRPGKNDETTEPTAAKNLSIRDNEARQRPPRQLPKSLSQPKTPAEETLLFRELAAEAEILERQARSARECPVPKPSGWVGRVLGFDGKEKVEGRSVQVERVERGEKGLVRARVEGNG